MNTLVSELNKYINSLENERKEILNKLKNIDEQINIVKSFRQTIKEKPSFKIIEPGFFKNQELINILKEKRKKHKITQMEAIKKIAEEISDENKVFRLNELKNIMVEAGFFKTPKNATSILITIIKRNISSFEKIEPGVYKLIEKENKDNLVNNLNP